jgi:hypothetical protein
MESQSYHQAMCLYLTSLIAVDQKSIISSNDVPDLHDVIDFHKPYWATWLRLLAQPGGSSTGSIKWLHSMA